MPAPVRAAWHRDVRHPWRGGCAAGSGGPADAAGRSGGGDAAEPMDEWMLDWLARTADPLVGQAPEVAAELSPRPWPAAQLGRTGAAGWRPDSLMPFSVSVTRPRPAGGESRAEADV